MAPLPDTGTARVFIDYSGITGQHTLKFRVGGTPTPELCFTRAQGLCGVLAGLWTDEVSVDLVRLAPVGSTVTFPIGVPSISPNGGANAEDSQDSKYLTFLGRTITGRRGRFFVYNTAPAVPSDYRYEAGETNAAMLGVLSFLNATSDIVAIDGAQPAWVSYVNSGYSAYWQKAYRRVR